MQSLRSTPLHLFNHLFDLYELGLDDEGVPDSSCLPRRLGFRNLAFILALLIMRWDPNLGTAELDEMTQAAYMSFKFGF